MRSTAADSASLRVGGLARFRLPPRSACEERRRGRRVWSRRVRSVRRPPPPSPSPHGYGFGRCLFDGHGARHVYGKGSSGGVLRVRVLQWSAGAPPGAPMPTGWVLPEALHWIRAMSYLSQRRGIAALLRGLRCARSCAPRARASHSFAIRGERSGRQHMWYPFPHGWVVRQRPLCRLQVRCRIHTDAAGWQVAWVGH
jgi:hypothetical protein